MSLTDVLDKLYARRRFGIRPGVDRVGVLLSRLGHPEQKFRTIHVVGTNGKGSTSAFLSAIIRTAGFRTGQFSSPHLVRFTERFRINGTEYPAEKLATVLTTVLAAAPAEATFFEITTALAAYIFAEEQVEFAVMEAGMGGRSDATAAFSGELTVVTPISLDHTDYLGSTLEAIAQEKAGIICSGTRVVSAAQDELVHQVIANQCLSAGATLAVCGTDFSATWQVNGLLNYHGIATTLTDIAPGIGGRYQAGNAAVALAAAETLGSLGVAISSSSCREGVTHANWPGRMELIPGSPRLLLDGAHNPAGAEALAAALSDYPRARLLLVTGICDDKDLTGIYTPLLPYLSAVYAVKPAVERALPAEQAAAFFRGHGVVASAYDSVAAGLAAASKAAAADDLLLVCGSLFVVGEVKALLEQAEFTGIRG
jgi:dihydrofolate synthase/folylpolyglutamate synthase